MRETVSDKLIRWLREPATRRFWLATIIIASGALILALIFLPGPNSPFSP